MTPSEIHCVAINFVYKTRQHAQQLQCSKLSDSDLQTVTSVNHYSIELKIIMIMRLSCESFVPAREVEFGNTCALGMKIKHNSGPEKLVAGYHGVCLVSMPR